MIEQVPTSVKLDPQTGEVTATYTSQEESGPLHMPYKGPERKVQCAVCGLNEDEHRFIQYAKSQK